jgi:hypothetical protein
MMAHTGAIAAGALATTSAPSDEAGELDAGASTDMPIEVSANDGTQNDPSEDESFVRDAEPGDRPIH